MTDFDFRELCQAWADYKESVSGPRPGPSPSVYFMLIIHHGDIFSVASELGLTATELARQLDTNNVSEEHWPAILEIELSGRRYAEELGESPALMGISMLRWCNRGKTK